MSAIELAALSRPVSESEPCGPDLDVAGEPDYMNFMANAEGLLPARFFEFDRASIDFAAQFETARKFIDVTRDIRLLSVLAKFHALDRDLDGFAACIDAIATLLEERWDEVHPRVEDGNFDARAAPLNSLDDSPTIMFPLQYAPLAQTERQGPVSYRSFMIASGEVKARQGEQAFDSSGIEKALNEADLPTLVATRDQIAQIQEGYRRIRNAVSRAGFDQSVSFENVPALVPKMLALVEGVVARRDPSAALQQPEPEPELEAAGEAGAPSSASAQAVMRGRVRSVADAGKALAAVASYFDRAEPSSPALLLIRQAEQLIGKSFIDVMRVLVPARVQDAQVQLGTEQVFSLQLEKLSGLAAKGGAGNGAAAPAAAGESGGAASDAIGEVATRQEAVALLDDVGVYYRSREPSSPIPLLTDRARGLVERDFLYLLKDLLPEPPPPPAKK